MEFDSMDGKIFKLFWGVLVCGLKNGEENFFDKIYIIV